MAYKALVVVAEQAVTGYCSNLAKVTAAEYKYLLHAAHELRASLAPHSRTRAALVSWHLVIAALLAKAAMGQAVDTYAKFYQQFGEDLIEAEQAARRRTEPAAVTDGREGHGSMRFGSGGAPAKKTVGGMSFGGGR
jgi:hypothetical protein